MSISTKSSSLLASLLMAGLLVSASAKADCPMLTVVVDNDAPGSGYSETKAHNWASRPVGACQGNYRYLSHDKQVAPNNDGTRTGKAIWKPAITISGTYEVTISYRATTNRTNDADYFVYDDMGGTSHTVVDQKHSGDCTKVKLGSIYCKVGGNCRVVLDGTDDSQSDAADATSFKLLNCDEPQPGGVCDGISAQPSYELCEQSANSCAGVFTDGSGCVAYCAAANMICTARFGGEPGCQKEPANIIPCEANNGHASDWCECSLPPGSGGSGGSSAGGSSAAGGMGGALAPQGGAGTGGSSSGQTSSNTSSSTTTLAPTSTADCTCRLPAGQRHQGPWPWLAALLAAGAIARRSTRSKP